MNLSKSSGSAERHNEPPESFDALSPELKKAIEAEVGKQLAARVAQEVEGFSDEFSNKIAELVVQKLKGTPENPILLGLPNEQQQILNELLNTPEHDIKAAQTILDQLNGQRLTENLTRSISNVLRRKSWRLLCGKQKCTAPATLRWKSNRRYREGGSVSFSHLDGNGRSVHHSGMTIVKDFLLVRAKAKKDDK